MGGRNSILINQTEFIEKNLNDLQFKISDEEVQYIQNGIETLVYEIFNDISNAHVNEIESRKQDLMNEAKRNGVELEETFSREKLIKAGSFYEGTKNYFPKEFDFVFLLGTFRSTECCALYHLLSTRRNYQRHVDLREPYFKCIDVLYFLFENKEYTYHLGNLFGEINFSHSVEISGPAFKIQFVYKKPNEDDIEINVDIVPAFKIIDPFLTEELLNKKQVCTIPEFHRFIAETGSYIVTSTGKVSFVETEKRFISTVLHPHHKDVYRLVKHLINGDDQNETLKEVCKNNSINIIDISSFTIKTTVIWHHFRCRTYLENIKHRCSVVCAREIMLDLQDHLCKSSKRHILFAVELASMRISPERSDKFEKWWSLGNNYLTDCIRVLPKSLHPKQGSDRIRVYSKLDKSYSQYMLENCPFASICFNVSLRSMYLMVARGVNCLNI